MLFGREVTRRVIFGTDRSVRDENERRRHKIGYLIT